MSLQQQFDEMAEKVRKLSKKPTNEELLELYGLYKQATVGDNTTEKPSCIDIKMKRKWEVWIEKQGLSKEDAQNSYISHAKDLILRYS